MILVPGTMHVLCHKELPLLSFLLHLPWYVVRGEIQWFPAVVALSKLLLGQLAQKDTHTSLHVLSSGEGL